MILRTLQLLIVITGAVLGAALASCAARPTASRIIPHDELRAGLHHRFPMATVLLEDDRYEIVTQRDVLAAVTRARVPYRPDIADCDDIAADALHYLRRRRYTDLSCSAPPAAGRLVARVEGVSHALLWYVDDTTLRLQILDPQSARPVPPESLRPSRVTDK